MARTDVPAQTLAGSYPAMPAGLVAGAADLTWTAANVSDKNDTELATYKTLVLARNVGATTARHVTFTSTTDGFGRTGDITAYAIAAGKVARFGPFGPEGWAVGGRLEFEADHVDVQFAVLTLP